MKRFARIILIFVLLISPQLHGENFKLNQKEGIWQDKKEKQIEFVSFERINFDFDKVPLKYISKISLHKNNIFILDSKRNELYVIDKKGSYLYTIGRPGQGPGDLEYGWDFFISGDEKIYVLNSMPKRIEVFDIKGKPIESIRLDIPGFGILPEAIIIDKDKNLIISSSFKNIIAVYDANGSHLKTLLKRDDLENYSKNTLAIGIPSRLEIIDNHILHFDLYKGIFTKIDLSGHVVSNFNAYDERISRDCDELEAEYKDSGEKGYPKRKVTFRHFNSFCVDYLNRIYAVPSGRKKGEIQKLFVFSPYGNLLYKKPLDFFTKMQVKHICCEKDSFVFATHDLILILANRRKK